jgi:hypothetical protein
MLTSDGCAKLGPLAVLRRGDARLVERSAAAAHAMELVDVGPFLTRHLPAARFSLRAYEVEGNRREVVEEASAVQQEIATAALGQAGTCGRARRARQAGNPFLRECRPGAEAEQAESASAAMPIWR